MTAVGLVTIGLSTYLIRDSHRLVDRLAPRLTVFERRSGLRPELDPIVDHIDVVG